jgi:hypothetical protein
MINRMTFLLFLLACTLSAPAIPPPQGTEPIAPNNGRFGDSSAIGRKLQGNIYGVVKKIDEKEITLDKTKFGVDTSIRLDSRTKYVRDKKPSSIDKLKIGDSVYVDVKTEKKTGAMTAKRVVSGMVAAL